MDFLERVRRALPDIATTLLSKSSEEDGNDSFTNLLGEQLRLLLR